MFGDAVLHVNDEKKKIFKKFLSKYTVNFEQVGEGEIYSYSLANFYKFTGQLFKKFISG
jgi:hypothetical protein